MTWNFTTSRKLSILLLPVLVATPLTPLGTGAADAAPRHGHTASVTALSSWSAPAPGAPSAAAPAGVPAPAQPPAPATPVVAAHVAPADLSVAPAAVAPAAVAPAAVAPAAVAPAAVAPAAVAPAAAPVELSGAVANLRFAPAMAAAGSVLGRPYRWGGSTPSGFDCSGLVLWSFAHAGISLPHSSRAQRAVTTPVPREAALPGDLVFFGHTHHVGIYMGDGLMIHSPRSGKTVEIVPIDRFGSSPTGFGRVG